MLNTNTREMLKGRIKETQNEVFSKLKHGFFYIEVFLTWCPRKCLYLLYMLLLCKSLYLPYLYSQRQDTTRIIYAHSHTKTEINLVTLRS